MWHGLVDYRLGLILGVTAFFDTAVWLLGQKVLFFDLLGYRAGCNASAQVSE